MTIRGLLLMTILLVLTAPPAGAELRQWTDENGVRHFSNRKALPGGVSADRSWEEKESRGEPRPAPQSTPASGPPPSKTGKTPAAQTNFVPLSAADIRKEISLREARLRELFESIYTKRRYVKRQGKKDIERIRRLQREIAILTQNRSAHGAEIGQLEAEKDAALKRLFNENLRTRKGVGKDIREYQKIEAEIKQLRGRL